MSTNTIKAVFKLTAATIGLLTHSVAAFPQQVTFSASGEIGGKSGYHLDWDSESQRMIAYRDTDDPALPVVRVLSSSGNNVALYPLKDFPDANHIDVWAVAGAPHGDIIISATLTYGPRGVRPSPVKSLLLTYDATGTLRRVWDVEPYLHHHLAADSTGNVFALGEKGFTGENYPLLIKYSETGEVLRESLSSNLFASKAEVVGSGSPNGEAEVFVKNDHVIVWIAVTQELFTLSLDGVLLSKTALSSAIQNMAVLSSSSRVRVLELHVDSNQGILLQVQLWPEDKKMHANVTLARIAPNGSFDSWVEPISAGEAHRFLGLAANDKNVFLEKVDQKTVKVDLR
jgi:hypothetical protein